MSHPDLSAQLRNRDSIRWGIIGCGDVAEVKSGPGFQRADRSQLVAVMRRDGERAADFARRHGVARWYDEADRLIADPEVDAVYIATPPGTHEDYAVRVAAAGKPAYVEKPMARHTMECDRMIEAFAAAGQKLFVAYYRRRMPRFVCVQDLLEARAIGRVTGVRYRLSAPSHRDPPTSWRVNAEQAGAGLFLDVGSHALDLLDHYFGPLTQVHGFAANRGSSCVVEDNVNMSFVSESGIPGAASWNFAADAREDLLEILGTDGTVRLSLLGNEPVRLERNGAVESIERPNPPHVQQPLIQAAVDDLLGRGTCPSTGVTARRTSRVMDHVLAAYYGGRDDAFWARPDTWPGRPVPD